MALACLVWEAVPEWEPTCSTLTYYYDEWLLTLALFYWFYYIDLVNMDALDLSPRLPPNPPI